LLMRIGLAISCLFDELNGLQPTVIKLWEMRAMMALQRPSEC